ncbi:lantibiotic dehydratase [Streptomyces sp. NPDC021356]|uniref:lantibiotic dehydratase n=1 Tax=Streptomyces sp. NPDC021356 TaxID=3154900 RepID=UPI0033ED9785
MAPGAPTTPAAPSATAPGAGPLSAPVGVRIAGLPGTALDASRIPRSTELATRIVSLDQRLAADAECLGAALYALIGTEPARPFKARLVGLRRAVHQGARITALLDRTAPPHVLGTALTERLHRHCARHRTRAVLFAELEHTLAAETRSAAAALAGLVRDHAFAAGLGYASADLYDDVLRWSERDGAGRRPLDGAAVRLAKYAARAMAKPSPLTTFAAAGFGRWAADADTAVRLESTVRTEVAEASLLPLSRIAAAVALLPELDAAVRLRVNPWATRVRSTGGDEQWLFTAPGPSGEVRALPATPALDAILAAAREAGSPQRLRALLGAPEPGATTATGVTATGGAVNSSVDTATSTGSTAASNGGADATTSGAHASAGGADITTGSARTSAGGADGSTGIATADAVLARLVRLGLLEIRLGLPDQELDAASLCDWLSRHLPAPGRDDRVWPLLADLRAVRDRTDAARAATPGSHREIAATVHARTTDAARRLGLLGGAERLERGTPYFHNTLAAGTTAVLDPAAWRTALDDLALVPALLAPFDTLTPRREALRHSASTAYGPGFVRPLTGFLQDFGARWAEAGHEPPTERDVRRRDELRRLIADAPPAPDGTVRLAPRAVRQLCGAWPDPHTAGDRHACYVQTLPDGGAGPALVLNTVTCGHGTGLTRIARRLGTPHPCPPATEEPVRDDSESATLYAEFDATFGSALNQRAPATRYAVDLDGATSHRPADQLIRPADLDVVHDRHTRRLHLVHRPTGRVVRPLHLGLLATPLLPLPARLMVEAFGQTPYTFWSDWPQFWQLLGPVLTDSSHRDPEPAVGAGWTKVPRLALGAVVLRRAAWFVGPGRAPARAAGEQNAAYLVRVHAWRVALGLPTCCFLRVLTPRPAGGFTGPALHDKDRKPVYLDFSHPHLLRLFERAAATGRPLLLTEALPDLHDAPADRDGRRYAAEFLIELPPAGVGAAERGARTC